MEFSTQKAKEKKLTGYVLTLDFPIYLATMTYADNQKLRETMYRAFSTRASDQKPANKKYDNSATMNELLKLRYKMAKLIGFQNYADYSLQTKMAKSSGDVISFLNKLSKKSMPFARREFKELEKFAGKKLKAWDIAYYAEKLKHKKFDFDEEMLRPYFQESIVLKGLFELVEKLFSIQIREKQIKDKWHKDVCFFEIKQNKKLIGGFYTDLYAREGKRGGAWMDDCQGRRKLSHGEIQLPIAFLTCNFSQPLNKKPSLLTHDEVITLFHEFGHCLHHLLTKIDYPEISGINGVEWDAVELPSQFMENFCWDKKVLDKITRHTETGKKLPADLFKKLLSSQHYHAGLAMMRQLQFALFDFEMHKNYKSGASKNYIQSTLNAIRKKTSVFKTPTYNRFQHSFSHIFAGGYSAGYYSYKWAEVLSADAFSLFEEKGILNKKTGQSFLKNILEKGGSKNAMELFIAFRGRKPLIDALLIHSGLLQVNLH
jgi:oligopeptidase A